MFKKALGSIFDLYYSVPPKYTEIGNSYRVFEYVKKVIEVLVQFILEYGKLVELFVHEHVRD